MLYSSSVKLSGNFSPLPLQKLNLAAADIAWNDAYVCIAITDAKGLKDELQIKWNDSTLSLTPSYINNAVFKEGLCLPGKSLRSFNQFRYQLFIRDQH
jgi:inner membrane protein